MATYEAIVRWCTCADWKDAVALCNNHPLLIYFTFSITAAAMYWWMSHYTGADLCLALMPYLLPKMHNRYFFPADIFSFALLAFNYRLWSITAAFQLGSLFAYIPYFFHGITSYFIIVAGPAIGSLFISMGLLVLALLNAIEFGPTNAHWRRKLEEKMSNWYQPHVEPGADNSN